MDINPDIQAVIHLYIPTTGNTTLGSILYQVQLSKITSTHQAAPQHNELEQSILKGPNDKRSV